MLTVYFDEKIMKQCVTEGHKKLPTSPVAATWPVIPMFMGKRDSNGLVLSLRSSLASKSNTREKLPLDASCTNSIYSCGC